MQVKKGVGTEGRGGTERSGRKREGIYESRKLKKRYGKTSTEVEKKVRQLKKRREGI